MSNSTSAGLLGLDRKEMERDRLRRLALKRNAEQAGIAPSDPHSREASAQRFLDATKEILNDESLSKREKVEKSLALIKAARDTERSNDSTHRNHADKRSHKSPPVGAPTTISSSKSPLANAAPLVPETPRDQQIASPMITSPTVQNPKVEYPFGVLKNTWAFGHDRKGDIKIEEVLQKADLTTAVISSWQWDFDWLMTKIDSKRTKCIFVMEAKTQADKSRILEDFAGLTGVRLCFPPMSNNMYARMHSKLMLLFHPSHLRIVIPSANPVRHDWGEGGLIGNTVFVIDLPRLEGGAKEAAKREVTLFQKELLHFLNAMELSEDAINGGSNFDFSNTKDLAFVHSIPGSAGPSGLACLSTSVELLNLATPISKKLEVDFASASVGSLDQTQIDQFCASLRGLDPRNLQESTKGRSSSKNENMPDTTGSNSFRLVFPSEHTVKHSKGGADAGGTIFLKKHAFDKSTFPHEIIREFSPTRQGLLSHNKLILVRSPTSAYIYNGSANLSQSAWGRISQPKGQQTPKLTITNWECGVLVPVARVESGWSDEVLPYSVFDKHLEIPLKCPPEEYQKGRKPWLTN